MRIVQCLDHSECWINVLIIVNAHSSELYTEHKQPYLMSKLHPQASFLFCFVFLLPMD